MPIRRLHPGQRLSCARTLKERSSSGEVPHENERAVSHHRATIPVTTPCGARTRQPDAAHPAGGHLPPRSVHLSLSLRSLAVPPAEDRRSLFKLPALLLRSLPVRDHYDDTVARGARDLAQSRAGGSDSAARPAHATPAAAHDDPCRPDHSRHRARRGGIAELSWFPRLVQPHPVDPWTRFSACQADTQLLGRVSVAPDYRISLHLSAHPVLPDGHRSRSGKGFRNAGRRGSRAVPA